MNRRTYYREPGYWLFAAIISAIALLIFTLTSCKKQEPSPLQEYDIKFAIEATTDYSYKYGVIKPDGNKSSQSSTVIFDHSRLFQFQDAYSGDSVYFTATYISSPQDEFIGMLQIGFTTQIKDTANGTITIGYKLPE